MDHLGKRSDMMVQSMKIDIVSVNFRDKEADAVVSVSPKTGGGGIQMNYSLVMEGNKWTVKAPAGGANPHGGGAMPGGAMPTPGGGMPTGQMPPGHPPVGGMGNGAVHGPATPKANP